MSGKSYLSVRRLFRRLSVSMITSHGAVLAAAAAAAFSAALVADEFSHYQSHYGQQDESYYYRTYVLRYKSHIISPFSGRAASSSCIYYTPIPAFCKYVRLKLIIFIRLQNSDQTRGVRFRVRAALAARTPLMRRYLDIPRTAALKLDYSLTSLPVFNLSDSL